MKAKRFGRVIAVEFSRIQKGNHYWKCICDCGTTKDMRIGHLVSGAVRSCGCLKREVWIKERTSHGLRKTKEYQIWSSMMTRCSNKKTKCYKNYGGRGIKVCKRWLKFENFYNDMGCRPSNKHSIDRVNNDGNYEPSNCRWATIKQQANNRRNKKIKE